MLKILTVAATAVLWLACAAAHATPPDTSSMPQLALPQATPPDEVTTGPTYAVTATAASNYIFRGVSQTENQGAIFGAARAAYDDFYAGASF
jgi:hypothetical protein